MLLINNKGDKVIMTMKFMIEYIDPPPTSSDPTTKLISPSISILVTKHNLSLSVKYSLPYFVFIHRLPWRQTVSASTSQSRKCLIKLELSSSLLFRSIKFHERVLANNHSGFVFALSFSSWALRLDSDPSHVGCFFGICYYVPTLLCCSFLVLLADVLQSADMC